MDNIHGPFFVGLEYQTAAPNIKPLHAISNSCTQYQVAAPKPRGGLSQVVAPRNNTGVRRP